MDPTIGKRAVERDRFLAAMRRAAATVTVVTTAGPGGRLGLTVSAMCSLSAALSEQQRCVRGQHRSPNLKLRLGHKSMPLGQCGRASVLVNVTGDEMALLIEMVVDLGVN